MTERNEQTSPDIASFAAKLLKMPDAELVRQAYHNPEQFRSLAASLLTQAPDNPNRPEPPEAQIVQVGVKFPGVPVANKVERKPRASKPRT